MLGLFSVLLYMDMNSYVLHTQKTHYYICEPLI
jgi:hypothetical protein